MGLLRLDSIPNALDDCIHLCRMRAVVDQRSAASKAALIGIARTLPRALGRSGARAITVNCVAPGMTPTPAAVADTPTEAFAEVRARQAIDRSLAPEDVAATVAFLASDGAGAITGQTLCVDGGLARR